MGHRDQAIDMLEKFFVEHSPVIPTLKTEPVYDPLRSDPRFQALLRRVRLANKGCIGSYPSMLGTVLLEPFSV